MKEMEYRSAVFNAARDGKLTKLRIFLDHKSREEIIRLVHAKTYGATPLIMACRNGHLDIVKYLLQVLDDDHSVANIVGQVGSVTFDGETIEGAPPLWCAAAAGHLSIVRMLVEKGGDVNKTTLTNSTPLRAACFDGHFDIVKFLVFCGANIEIANRHGHTCLMISCYKDHMDIAKYLLQLGADVNRKSVKGIWFDDSVTVNCPSKLDLTGLTAGNTALHDCAESGSLEIMRLLLASGATMERDAYGMTPLLAASISGYTTIVEFLTARPECQKVERINALELLGATYVDKKRDMLGALNFWRQAMEDRFADNSKPVRKPSTVSKVAAYENAVEVTTLDQLEDLISDPDDMRMQALLVRERILGPAHPDTSYYIRYRGALYADMGNFDRCITLWMYALDMQQGILEALSPMTQSSFLSFAELFSFMTTEWRSRPAYPIAFSDIMSVLTRAVDELERGGKVLLKTEKCEAETTNYNRLLLIIMHLFCLMCRIQSSLTTEEEHLFKKTAYKLIQMHPKGAKNFSPLHLACSRETTNVGRYPVCSFPSASVVRLLVEVGAPIDDRDDDNNTPLHVAASNRPCKSEVIRALLGNGAHIDACNCDRKTPMQLIRGLTIYDIVSPLNYLSLQCLAARKIVKCGIPYQGQIPKKMEMFVEMH